MQLQEDIYTSGGVLTQMLPTSLTKDNDRMKLDSKTYFDRKEKQIIMAADHISRLDKILIK